MINRSGSFNVGKVKEIVDSKLRPYATEEEVQEIIDARVAGGGVELENYLSKKEAANTYSKTTHTHQDLATIDYVDTEIAKIPSGGEFDPKILDDYATIKYVDSEIAKIPSGGGGGLDPKILENYARKEYVDILTTVSDYSQQAISLPSAIPVIENNLITWQLGCSLALYNREKPNSTIIQIDTVEFNCKCCLKYDGSGEAQFDFYNFRYNSYIEEPTEVKWDCHYEENAFVITIGCNITITDADPITALSWPTTPLRDKLASDYYTKTEVDTKIAEIPSGGGGGSSITNGTATVGFHPTEPHRVLITSERDGVGLGL